MTRKRVLLALAGVLILVNVIYLLITAQVQTWNILTIFLAAALGAVAVQGENY